MITLAQLEPVTDRVLSIKHTDEVEAATLVADGWIELTQDQLDASRRAGTRFALIDGAIVRMTPLVQDLATFLLVALDTIDRAAEQARLRFITAGSGQALEYQNTLEEARAFVAGGRTGTATDFPWLGAEAASTPEGTLTAAADSVIAQANAWKIAGTTIKEIRRSAKIAAAAATTNDAVQAIVDGLRWPMTTGGLDPDPPPPPVVPPFVLPDYSASTLAAARTTAPGAHAVGGAAVTGRIAARTMAPRAS